MLEAILEALDQGVLDPQSLNPALFVSRAGDILEGAMGGTIGACTSPPLSRPLILCPNLHFH